VSSSFCFHFAWFSLGSRPAPDHHNQSLTPGPNFGVRLNPYAKQLKKAVTIRLDPAIIDYFKSMSGETHIPYQNLINLYLLDCAKAGRKVSLAWKK
jgi:uncharacterized protein (DUF4415 family)